MAMNMFQLRMGKRRRFCSILPAWRGIQLRKERKGKERKGKERKGKERKGNGQFDS
jgi:hypothetical protein